MEISGKQALTILRLALNIALGEGQGGVVLNAVQSIEFKGKNMIINLESVPLLRAKGEYLKNRIKDIRDEIALLGDPEVIREYYSLLADLGEKHTVKEPVSLSHFIGPLFSRAMERSIGGNESEENQAAILALATYLGSGRFGSFTGHVNTKEMKLKRRFAPQVVLAGRNDLRLHFIISAGLKIISDKGITYAVGELKELIDAGRGGSGFSFVDLAADRAGTRFAEVATGSSAGARNLQRLLAANVSEDNFFPEALDLPEGLSKKDFEQTYGTVESTNYLRMVKNIDYRISQLSIHQGIN